MNKLELMKTANEVRKGIVTAVHSAKSGHPGGSLSAADIYTYLYFEEMNIDPKDPKKADRDRFVLSKGHTAPGYYSTLAHRGFFPVEDLTTLRKVGSYLQGHPDMKHIPGVDMSSGSLGQGISAAVGMAISAKLSNDDYRVYTLLGDGEIQEGQVWEASMLAGHRKLDNLVVIVDNNNLQIDGKITDVNSPYPIDKKFEAFNFHVINIDGNDFDQIDAAFKEAKATKGMPTAIIAHTVKGKGVSFMENQVGWHGTAPNDEQYAVAMEELENGNVWANREFLEKYPMYMAGVRKNGELVMLICIQQVSREQMSLYFLNLFKILSGLVETSLLRALEYQKAVEYRQYVKGTHILKTEYFEERLKVQHDMREQKLASYVLLKVEYSEMSLKEADEILRSKVRENDVWGISESKELYLMLVQTDKEALPIILARLKQAGLVCRQIDEELTGNNRTGENK